MYTLNCGGKIRVFEKPAVMGILNITPDSFYEGHLGLSQKQIIEKVSTMVNDGADIIDIGGQSSRPGSPRINAKEEISRVLPALKAIIPEFPDLLISIDTYHSEVARAAVNEGASIVNDISGGEMDHSMIETVGSLKCPYVCMHMQGTPETMQKDPQYNNLLETIKNYFDKKITKCEEAGITDIILDPGFGFGKTISHNLEILKNLDAFTTFGKPILAGLSRKSTIYRTLGTDAEGALNGTTVMNTIALMNGADILRVHDVKEAKEAITLFTATYKK